MIFKRFHPQDSKTIANKQVVGFNNHARKESSTALGQSSTTAAANEGSQTVNGWKPAPAHETRRLDLTIWSTCHKPVPPQDAVQQKPNALNESSDPKPSSFKESSKSTSSGSDCTVSTLQGEKKLWRCFGFCWLSTTAWQPWIPTQFKSIPTLKLAGTTYSLQTPKCSKHTGTGDTEKSTSESVKSTWYLRSCMKAHDGSSKP